MSSGQTRLERLIAVDAAATKHWKRPAGERHNLLLGPCLYSETPSYRMKLSFPLAHEADAEAAVVGRNALPDFIALLKLTGDLLAELDLQMVGFALESEPEIQALVTRYTTEE